MIYTRNFPVTFAPDAHSESVILAPGVRFTVLTERLLRLECDPDHLFEDRPSQVFGNRCQPVPRFLVKRDEEWLELETNYLLLKYRLKICSLNLIL